MTLVLCHKEPGPFALNIEELSHVVARWAAAHPLVVKAHVFGSRVKGTHSPNSDLDVAVELCRQPGDEAPLATWVCEADGLRESLGRALPVPLDLQWYGGPRETPTIHAALLCAGRAVYSACAEPTSSGGCVCCTHSIPLDAESHMDGHSVMPGPASTRASNSLSTRPDNLPAGS